MRTTHGVSSSMGRLLLLAACAFAGCAKKGPEVVPVAGTVTRGGQPVSGLFLNFKPVQGRPSWGLTDGEGRFSLNYTRDQNGARVGEHTVWVVHNPRPKDPREEMEMLAGKKLAAHPEMVEILKKYGTEAESPLRFNIQQRTENLEIKLD